MSSAVSRDASGRADLFDRRSKPRLLLITPDFPPDRGGIQVLAHRLATGLGGFERRVITLDSPGARGFDATSGLAIRRVRSDRRLGGGRNAPLNAIALFEALRFRPHVTLSAHIVTSPAAALIHRTLGSPTLQYFHAKEVGAKPRLAAFAARQAQDVIAVSEYTSGLVAATGAFSADVHLISPGVDLPADIEPLPEPRPTFLTIARLEDRYKGHDVLIRALPLIRAKVPDVHWVVIGDGPLRPGLEQLARSLRGGGLDRLPRCALRRSAQRLAAAHPPAVDAQSPAGGWLRRRGLWDRLSGGSRLRQAGGGWKRRWRARCGGRSGDRSAGRPHRPSRGGQGDHAAAARSRAGA